LSNRQVADILTDSQPAPRDREQFEQARARAETRRNPPERAPSRPQRAPMSVRGARPDQGMPGDAIAGARDERRAMAERDAAASQPVPETAPVDTRVPQEAMDGYRATREREEAEARARAEARQAARPQPNQGPPDRYQAEAEARARVIPEAASAAAETIGNAATAAGRAGLNATSAVAEGVARRVGTGLSVLGMTGAGATLARGADALEGARANQAAPAQEQAAPEVAAPEQPAPEQPRRQPPPISLGPTEMSRPVPDFEAAVEGVAAAAPATAEALAAPAQALSAAEAIGARPGRNQYQAAAEAAHQRFVTVAGPRQFNRLLEEGRVAEAYQWKAFYESQAAQEQTNHFSRAVFATTMGDARTAIREATLAVANSEIGDTYEIVERESGFLGDNDDLFARFTFRNKRTGETFVQSFATMEDFVGGLASVASAESAFERSQEAIRARVNEIIARQSSDEDRIVKLTEMFYKEFDDLFGGQDMTPGEKLETAQRLAMQTVTGARAGSRGGLGSLGVSQGGSRSDAVPSIGGR
jgi:hypothetical protein